MTPADLQLLKDHVHKIVEIICTNREVMLARVLIVSEEDEDVIYDLVTTTNESQYEKHDEQPAYLIRFEDIEQVSAVREK